MPRRVGLAVLSAVVLVGGGVGFAVAATGHAPHRGMNGYGMTRAYHAGDTVNFTYTKGYFCDTSVTSSSSSKCEVGANYKHAPAKDFDPLYITVPLGFSVPMNMIDCPSRLVCVDHPGKIDLTRLEPALKPLYPKLSKAQLTAALKNFITPEHDHFVTTTNGDKPEWWDVKVIGVTSPKTFAAIRAHKSYSYIRHLLKKKNKAVLGPIPSNLFLYFAV
jgi:hypothetical protein